MDSGAFHHRGVTHINIIQSRQRLSLIYIFEITDNNRQPIFLTFSRFFTSICGPELTENSINTRLNLENLKLKLHDIFLQPYSVLSFNTKPCFSYYYSEQKNTKTRSSVKTC